MSIHFISPGNLGESLFPPYRYVVRQLLLEGGVEIFTTTDGYQCVPISEVGEDADLITVLKLRGCRRWI